MIRSFPITDPHVLTQYNKILHALYKYSCVCAIAYHSNWYIVIACIDEITIDRIVNLLNKLGPWDIELRMGLKNKYHYIKLKFNQSS